MLIQSVSVLAVNIIPQIHEGLPSFRVYELCHEILQKRRFLCVRCYGIFHRFGLEQILDYFYWLDIVPK